MKKFRWVSNTDFKMINLDALEKRYRITNKLTLEQVGFCKIQMFDHNPVMNTEKFHYYFDTKSVLESPEQIYERLIRKQQLFKSAVLTDKLMVDSQEKEKSLYNVLITTDFNT